MTIRVLHLADLHLDSTYGGRLRTRARLRTATFEALARAVRFAMHEDLDAVLIAGDAFDDERLGYDARAVLRREVGRLLRAGIPVVYATGNHDPGAPQGRAVGLFRDSTGTPSERNLGRPGVDGTRHHAPVHVVAGGEPRTFFLEKRGVRTMSVTAAGHATAHVTDDLAARFERPLRAELPAIALLHTQVGSARGADGHAPYAPSDPATLRASDFDYWALGHVHVRGRVAADVNAWYAGNLQGRHAKESGPKGGLLVELDGDGLVRTPTFVAFSDLEFCTVDLDVPFELDTPEEVARATAEALRRELLERVDPQPPSTIIVRVTGKAASPALAALRDNPIERTSFEDAVASELGARIPGVDVLEVDHRLERTIGTERREERLAEIESVPSALREALRIARAIESGDGAVLNEAIDWSLSSSLGQEERCAAIVRIGRDLEDALIDRLAP